MQMKKKNRKSADFCTEVAQAVGHQTGDEVERLMKNLQMEYQKVKQPFHLPVCDTSDPPMLRNSSCHFQLFDTFYQLF